MKKLSFGAKKRSSRGFYIALAVSVVAVGSAAYFSLSRLNAAPQSSSPSQTLDNTTEWSIPEVDDVEKSETGVPKDTPQVIVKESEPASEETAVLDESEAEQTGGTAQAPASSPLVMPVTGEISNPYSNGELVKSKTLNEWRTHDGIDILAAEGTPVKSPGAGTVADIRQDSKWGNTVELEFPGEVTVLLCGMADDIKVKKGQELKTGDVIGSVGNSSIVESAEEMHLHVGVRVNGEWADPAEILTAE